MAGIINPVKILDTFDNTNAILSDYNLGPLDTVPDLDDGIVVAFVHYADATGVDGTPYIDGAGMSWSELTSVDNPNSLNRLIAAQGTGTADGSDIVVHIGGLTASAVWVTVWQLENADTVVQTATGTVDNPSAGDPLDVPFGSAPANSLPDTVGYATLASSSRGMGIALEASAPNGDNIIFDFTASAVNWGDTYPTPADFFIGLPDSDVVSIPFTYDAPDGFLAWLTAEAEAEGESLGYWGVLLKTRATLGLGGTTAYRNHGEYRDFKRYDH